MKKALIIVSTVFLMVSGCGRIPIFNHLNADDQPVIVPTVESICLVKLAKANLCFGIEWVEKATEEKAGSFRIKFTDGTSAKDPGRAVGVKLWMPSMGHGSSPVKVAQEKDGAGKFIAGSYLATDVYFIMGGEWEIWVQLKDGVQVYDQGKIDFKL